MSTSAPTWPTHSCDRLRGRNHSLPYWACSLSSLAAVVMYRRPHHSVLVRARPRLSTLGLHRNEVQFKALAGENVRVVGRSTSIAPGGRRYIVNEFLNNAYALARRRFDIYHPAHHRYVPLARARRMVVTRHDCTHEKLPAEFRYLDRVLRAKRALFARADKIVCISEASRQDLLRFYNVDSGKTRVIHHGFTRLQCSPEAAAELQRHIRRDYVRTLPGVSVTKTSADCCVPSATPGFTRRWICWWSVVAPCRPRTSA